jgi:hypothetical protein
MNQHDLVLLFIAAGNPVDTAWNMFIFVHITLVGGIYAMKRSMTGLERLFVSLLYSVFGWINWKALIGAYALYDSILLDIRATGQGASLYKHTFEFLSSHTLNDRTLLVTAIHACAWVLVMTFIATEKLFPHKKIPGA